MASATQQSDCQHMTSNVLIASKYHATRYRISRFFLNLFLSLLKMSSKVI